jgi:hypothetical protein
MAANHEAARIEDANKVMTLTETLEKELSKLRSDKLRLSNEVEEVKALLLEAKSTSAAIKSSGGNDASSATTTTGGSDTMPPPPPSYDNITSMSETEHIEALESVRKEAKQLALQESEERNQSIQLKLKEEIDALKVKLQQAEEMKTSNVTLVTGGGKNGNGAAAAAAADDDDDDDEYQEVKELGIWYEEKFSPEKGKFYYQKRNSDQVFWYLPQRDNGSTLRCFFYPFHLCIFFFCKIE